MISFKQSDLDEVRNSCRYLSDVFIEFYFTYLSSIHPSDSILFVPPTISFLLANFDDNKDITDCVKPLELHNKDLIFFPVNDGGIHWSLLVFYRKLNVFAHHDSLGGLNNDEAKDLYNAVKYCVHKKETLRYRVELRNKRRLTDGPSGVPGYARPETPRQKNGYDCGLYVMAMAKVICEWFCSGVGERSWMRELEKLDDSVGITMRPLVLQLIRDASEGRLGSVSCTIEEERRVMLPSSSDDDGDGNTEVLNNEEIELYQFWADFDDPVDSETPFSPSTSRGDDLPSSIAVGKIVANDSSKEETNNGKIPEVAVNDSEMVHRDSTSSSTSIVVENKSVKDVSTVEEKDMEDILDTTSSISDCRTSAFNREYLTQWPPV